MSFVLSYPLQISFSKVTNKLFFDKHQIPEHYSNSKLSKLHNFSQTSMTTVIEPELIVIPSTYDMRCLLKKRVQLPQVKVQHKPSILHKTSLNSCSISCIFLFFGHHPHFNIALSTSSVATIHIIHLIFLIALLVNHMTILSSKHY